MTTKIHVEMKNGVHLWLVNKQEASQLYQKIREALGLPHRTASCRKELFFFSVFQAANLTKHSLCENILVTLLYIFAFYIYTGDVKRETRALCKLKAPGGPMRSYVQGALYCRAGHYYGEPPRPLHSRWSVGHSNRL